MSFDDQFRDCMPTTITHAGSVRTTAFGVDIQSTDSVSIKARVQYFRRTVVDGNGQEAKSEITLYLSPTDTTSGATSIDQLDTITISTAYTTRPTPIVEVRRHDDEEGLHHWEVLL